MLHRDIIESKLNNRVQFATIGQNICRGASVAELTKIKYDSGVVDDYFTLAPEYLRESQAQRELNRKKMGKKINLAL